MDYKIGEHLGVEKGNIKIKETNKVVLNYYRACEKIRNAFVEKYFKHDDSFWIDGDIGGTLSFSDQFLYIDHLVKVLKLNMTDKELFDWYYWQSEFSHMKGIMPPINIEDFIRIYREDKTKIPEFEKDNK